MAAWEGRVDEVVRLLGHRGPDASGVWRSSGGEVLLVHTRLEIIGLGIAGAQPLTSDDGSVSVTFNGEIYNYRAIAQDLGIAHPVSDTAVLAELLARWGPSGLWRARGMFAFAAWDHRARRFLAGRDRFGIKPLYVLRHDDGHVSVASELPPLLLDPEARTVDSLGLAQFLAFGHTGPTFTVYDRVRKVPPGVVWEWRLDSPLTESRVHSIDGIEVAELPLSAAIDDTVRAHLVADVEVGVFLSGGIDSTLVAASAARVVPELRTFTISFPDRPAIDESALAEANAAALGTRHTTTAVRDADLVAAAAELVAQQGEPVGDAAALALRVLSKAASQDVKVVLTGEGADEIFGGYRRYDISRRLGSWPQRAAGAVAAPLARWSALHRGDRPRDRAIEAAFWGGGVRSHAALLGADINALASGDDPVFADVLRLARSDWRIVNAGDQRETARRFDMVRWLPNVYLEKVDRATMASSLEARVPYLDPVIEGLAARSPFGKGQLRADLVQRLPAVALPSRKLGLAIDLASLLEHPALGEALSHELHSSTSLVATTYSPATLDRLRHRAARSPTTAFRLAMVGLWESLVRLDAR